VVALPRHRSVETVVYVRDKNYLWLGFKKIRQGKGRYNGFGGGVKPHETIETAAVRELLEETGGHAGGGIIPLDMELRGIIQKYKNGKKTVRLYFFMVTSFKGKAIETDEMIPGKFKISRPSQIPYRHMHSGDKKLLPAFLRGEKIVGSIYFDEKGNVVYENLDVVDEIPLVINF
jgi:ADP-ribose pyrophosphatase YjhB (NUDIX family)